MSVLKKLKETKNFLLFSTIEKIVEVKNKNLETEIKLIKLADNKNSNELNIYVNGFTQLEDINFNDWLKIADKNISHYGLVWNSSTVKQIYSHIKETNIHFSRLLLSKNKIEHGKQIFSNLTSTPWTQALQNAQNAGKQLAEVINKNMEKDIKINLYGHSLGCRVIYYALQELKKLDNKNIQNVYLFAGAIGQNHKENWQEVSKVINGTIFNYYSEKDRILKILFQLFYAGSNKPIGLEPIKSTSIKIKNMNKTCLIKSHMGWKRNLNLVMREKNENRNSNR